jgi:hypothetical protein
VSGGDIFVANLSLGTIGEYTTGGATVNASLVSGLNGPYSIAVSGGDIFVGNIGNSTIGEYTTDGATVNPSLVSGMAPFGIVVVATPEPSTLALAGLAGLGMLWQFRRRK